MGAGDRSVFGPIRRRDRRRTERRSLRRRQAARPPGGAIGDHRRHLRRSHGGVGALRAPTSCSRSVPHSRAAGVDLPGADRPRLDRHDQRDVDRPRWIAGQPATMALVPLPPADQQSPPLRFRWRWRTPCSGPPGRRLHHQRNAAGRDRAAPASTFVARAFQGEHRSATRRPRQSMVGTFQLVLPSATAAAVTPLTIQLTPQSQTDPWFVSNPICPASPPIPALADHAPRIQQPEPVQPTVKERRRSKVKVAAPPSSANAVGTAASARRSLPATERPT